jgi:Transposase and inactivated derivatives
MKIKQTIGIDVSKKTLDVFIHSEKKHKCFKNEPQGFASLISWVGAQNPFENHQTLYAFEHTGLYSLGLSIYLTEQNLPFVLIAGLALKKSLGLARGKDDRIDSCAIALYTYRRREELTPCQLPSTNLLKIRKLLSLRDKLVKHRAGYQATLKETLRVMPDEHNQTYALIHAEQIASLTKSIKSVEKELYKIIASDEELNHQYRLITTIDGVGSQTAMFMIAFTVGFTLFENSRKFASYAGIAPFPYQSGTSIRGKTRISSLGNMKFKSLLSNCATSAIMNNAEMNAYYQRRISEGKDKMSTINIIRNKILGRIFAVVQRGTPYVNTMAYYQ